MPSKHHIENDNQPHLTAERKTLVLFQAHENPLSGDVSMTVRDADGNVFSGPTIMNDPENIPKQIGYIDVENIPQFPASLENPYVVTGNSDLALLNDPDATYLLSKLQENNQVEAYTRNGAWTSNIYLPDGTDAPAGSRFQLTCNSYYKVYVNYPNTVTGGWRKRKVKNRQDLVVVLSSEGIWLVEEDLEHNKYLFGKFYSAKLEAEWVQSGMTLEFQQGDQFGSLSDVEIGAITELMITTIDAGFLTTPRDEFEFAKDSTAHRDYFQTLQVTRLVVVDYEPWHLTEVMLPTGKLYTTASDDEGGIYAGDMRQYIGKELLSHGIDMANYGIFSSKGGTERPHPFTCGLLAAHNTRGMYQNGVQLHGLSGGNGIITLKNSIGNEFSHEVGHNLNLNGHYIGGYIRSVLSPADEINSAWEWDSDLDVFIPDFDATNSGECQSIPNYDECKPPYLGKYKFSRDSMAGGSPQWGRFTFYSPHSQKIIQDFLESRAIWDPTSSTGFRKFDSSTKKMEEWSNTNNGGKVPRLYRVPVTTIVGWYDPTANLQAYVFPAMYGAYGFVYEDDKTASTDGCSLHVETANRGTLIFELKPDINSSKMNKFHVNVATEDGANKATIYCQDQMFATQSLEGPKNPNLGYTVNGVPFDDDTNEKVTTKPETNPIVPETTTTLPPTKVPTPLPTPSPSLDPTTSTSAPPTECENKYSDAQCGRWKVYCPGGTRAGYEAFMTRNCCKECMATGWIPETTEEPTFAPTVPIGDNYGQECWSAYGCWGDKGTVCERCGKHDGKDMLCCRPGWNNHPNCNGAVFENSITRHQCVYIDTLSSKTTLQQQNWSLDYALATSSGNFIVKGLAVTGFLSLVYHIFGSERRYTELKSDASEQEI